MNDLIERLEKATGPSVSLNMAIWSALNPDQDAFTYNGDPRWEPYTASIDAALKLVPTGLMVTMTVLGEKASVSVKTGSIINPETKEWQAYGFTPAAISVAALKARAAIHIQQRASK